MIGREVEERQGKKERKASERKRQRGRSLVRVGRWVFLMLMIGRSLARVSVASESAQNRGGKMEVSQGENKTMESSWVQMTDKRSFQLEKEQQK